jgi:hypothetical protein
MNVIEEIVKLKERIVNQIDNNGVLNSAIKWIRLNGIR